MKRLTRSNEKVLAGVLSGITNYLNPEIDPVFLRITFAVLAFFNPGFVFLYLGLALVMPKEKVNVVQ